MRGFQLHKRDSCMIHAGENCPVFATGYMGKHSLMPEDLEHDENLLDLPQEASLDTEKHPGYSWSTGRGIGSVIPQAPARESELTPSEEATVRSLFDRIDVDGNLALDREEIFYFCGQLYLYLIRNSPSYLMLDSIRI